MTDRDEILRLAGCIAGGEDIDWDETESELSVVRNLRLIDSLMRTLKEQASSSPPLVSGDTWGELEIRRHIDEGATARVYLAWDPALEREVALKLYEPAPQVTADQLLKEGRLLARLDNDHVVRVYGAAAHDGRVGLWMEAVEGETLAQRFERGETLSVDEALALGRTLCEALAVVHGAGLIHGDIKAQNVMRRKDGRIVLVDLGAGRERFTSQDDSQASGTPLYLAPEVLAGGAMTASSDLYALGVLLFHALSGRFPWEADSMEGLMVLHRDGEMQRLEDLRPGLPESLTATLHQALAAIQEKRFATAGAMQQALLGATDEAPGAPHASRKGSGSRWFGALIMVFALAAATWYFAVNTPPSGTAKNAVPAYFLDAGFYRVGGNGERQRLTDGDPVAPGDRIVLDLAVSAPTWVYVYNEDDQGRAYALFPLPGKGPANPLQPGENHALPGGSANLAWSVTSAGGRERIHVLTSPEPLEALEALLAQLPPAARSPAPGEGFRTRGIGGLEDLEHPPPAPAGAVLAETRRLTDQGGVEGIHHQVIELSNSP